MAEKPTTQPVDAPEGAEEIVSTDQLADLQRERDDYYDRWMRKAAEFDNYRRRVEKERREQADQAVVDLMLDLLTVVDDFERAMAVDGGEAAAPYKKGVQMIHSKFNDLLRKRGVRP